jgi:hypothetical protein
MNPESDKVIRFVQIVVIKPFGIQGEPGMNAGFNANPQPGKVILKVR